MSDYIKDIDVELAVLKKEINKMHGDPLGAKRWLIEVIEVVS